MALFSDHKSELKLQQFMRNLIDATNPNQADKNCDRFDKRYNRVMPVLLAPWKNGAPIISETVVALTKDFSDTGVALILGQPFQGEMVALGYVEPHQQSTNGKVKSFFTLGEVRQNSPIGGGYWQLGVKQLRLLEPVKEPAMQGMIAMAPILVPDRS